MELDGVAAYQAQEEQREADRAVAVPQGFFPREPRGYYAKPAQRRSASRQSGSGHCMTGTGTGTYRDFVRMMLPKYRSR